MAEFLGFDHLDVRVPSLARVEPFYDVFLPALGLTRKGYAFVDARGDWHVPAAGGPYNTIEYFEIGVVGRPPRFIGFIEDPSMTVTHTRIAFAVASVAELEAWSARLTELGVASVERDDDFENYPALFFDDPAGTKLELCARLAPRTAASSGSI